MQQQIAKLKSKSKQLYELVSTENFNVDDVVAKSYATSVTPQSEMIIGGRSPHYNTGFTSQLVLKVTPINSQVPIKTLNFHGFSIVKAGDRISASIPKYRKEELGGEGYVKPFNRAEIIYYDRDFNSEESAIELALLSADGKILRRDKAVDYENFVKKY